MHDDLRQLSDRQLLEQLTEVVTNERKATAVVVEHLAEVERRGLHRDEGYSSLFEYCVGVLKLSQAEAYARIHAARQVLKYPHILPKLRDGQLYLSAINLLGPKLDENNHAELIEAACGKTKTQLETLLAERFPEPAVETVVRKLPTRPSSSHEATQGLLDAKAPQRPSTPACEPTVRSAQRPAARSQLTPLAPERFKVQLTAGKALHDKLQTARQLTRHQIPDGDLAKVLESALDLLIERQLKQHFAQSTRPRKKKSGAAPKPGSRHIPSEVRRAVARRDGMRCTFVSDSGHRCDGRERLEFHHEEAFARGGPSTADNIRLLCQAHNQLQAERDFGPLFMERERARSRRSTQV